MRLMNGAAPVPVLSRYSRLPGFRSCSSSVPVGLRLISTSSPLRMCCRREVRGPSGHLDAEELQVLLVVRAGDAVGAQQRPARRRAARPSRTGRSRNAAPNQRVVVKVNCVSVQCRTASTRSLSNAATADPCVTVRDGILAAARAREGCIGSWAQKRPL